MPFRVFGDGSDFSKIKIDKTQSELFLLDPKTKETSVIQKPAKALIASRVFHYIESLFSIWGSK